MTKLEKTFVRYFYISLLSFFCFPPIINKSNKRGLLCEGFFCVSNPMSVVPYIFSSQLHVQRVFSGKGSRAAELKAGAIGSADEIKDLINERQIIKI